MGNLCRSCATPYPNNDLGKQLRDPKDTLSAFAVLGNTFFDIKPQPPKLCQEGVMQFDPMTPEQFYFLHELICHHAGTATPRDIGPQTTQKQNSARQTCKRRGWVMYECGFWRITKAGNAAWEQQKEAWVMK